VEGYVAGLHKSPYHGFSIEFAEHREYAPGDDLRYVDWKVFGRTDKVYLKQYEDETNLICYLVLDISESMTYKSAGAAMSKLEYSQSLAAALAWLVLRQQDAVGLSTFDEKIRAMIRPAGNPSHLEQLCVMEALSGQKTAAGPIFHELAQRLTKGGVVVLSACSMMSNRRAGSSTFAQAADVVCCTCSTRPSWTFRFAGQPSSRAWKISPRCKPIPPSSAGRICAS
jgi:uncharacterized protein (DUF58 family)